MFCFLFDGKIHKNNRTISQPVTVYGDSSADDINKWFMRCLEILIVCRLISGLYCDIFLDYNFFYWVRIRSNVDLDLHGLYFIVKYWRWINYEFLCHGQSSTSMMWLFNCDTTESDCVILWRSMSMCNVQIFYSCLEIMYT